jgi:hypothetical protein
MDSRSHEEVEVMNHQITKTIREGNLMAEVKVSLIPDDGAWGPYLSAEDVLKLERVRMALKTGDRETAANDAEVFEVSPLGCAAAE